MQIQRKENALPTPAQKNNNNMQRAFSWKCRALLRADKARKVGVWKLEEGGCPAKWRPARECTDSVPKGPRGRRWGLSSPASRRNSTYITLQLFLRGGLSEPSRADHFAAAHGARLSGSGPGSGRTDGRARSRHSRRLRGAQRRGPRSPAAQRGPTGRADSEARRLRASRTLSQVGGREQKGAAPRRPTPRIGGRRRSEGAPASFQGVRLAARRPVPPPNSAAIGLRGTLLQHRARAPVPCAPPPRDRTSPKRSPKQTLRCTGARARAHTHARTHTMPRAQPTPARSLSVSVRPGRSSPSPSSGEAGSLPRTPGKRGGKGTPRGSRGRRAQGRSRGSGRARGGSRRSGRGAAEDRGAPLLCCSAPGMEPTVPSPRAPPAPPPPPGLAADPEPRDPRPRSLPLRAPSSSLSSSPSHDRASSGFYPDFL